MKAPNIFESYDFNNNYFLIDQDVLKIQSKFRQYQAKKKYIELKRLYSEKESLSNSSSVSVSNNQIDLEDCNDDYSNIEHEKSQLKSKNTKNPENNVLDITLASSLYSHYSNVNLAPPNEIKGYFLLKKKKYTHEGNTKCLTQTESTSNNNNNNNINNNNINNTNKNKNIKPTIIKEGFGIITWEDKSQLYSNFLNNKANGISKYIDNDNQISFIGEYVNNKPRGFGIYKNPKGTIFQGYWKNNVLNGIGLEIWKDSTFYQGEFKNNKKNGIGIYRWSDGTIYHGEWLNDEMTGFCIITYRDEKMYIGQIEKGIMNGYGEFSWKNGKKYLGYYKNDLKEGFGVFIYEQKPFQAYIGFWLEGKMDGLGLVIKGRNVKYGLWKKGEKKQRFKGPWEFKVYKKKGSAMFKNHFCINDGNSIINNKTITVVPTVSIISESDRMRDNDGFIKFMSKDVDYIREYIEKLL